jgi:Protein of unknown function (DUF2817)
MTSCLPVAAIDSLVFPSDFSSGREHWLQKLAEHKEQVGHHAYPCSDALGPKGETLMTDSVWIGSEQAANIIVLIGGTHGIEGFVGSAVEIDQFNLLAANHTVLPKNTAMLMIHALTPWGYAWQRRCDQNGVDLNRNIVDFSQPLPVNAGYDELRPALFSATVLERKAAFEMFANQHGRTAFECAISGGQYSDSVGPFYGGKSPAHGRLVVEDLMQRYSLHQRNLAVIDLHSGLGSYGYGEVICDHPPNSSASAVASQWYGQSVTLPALGTSSSVPKIGLLDYAWHQIMNDRSCYVTLEFGTFSTDQLFEVLLRDHQLWANPETKESRIEHSQVMKDYFCPNDQAWKEMVIFRARQVIAQALQGLSA